MLYCTRFRCKANQGKLSMIYKLLIPTFFSTLILTACSKEYTDELQKQMAEAKAKSEKIQARDKQQDQAKSIPEKTPIPISDSSDKGLYFLTTKEKTNKGFIIVYERKGVAQTTFSKYELNCKSKKMRSLGEGIDSSDNIIDYSEKGP